MSVFERLLVTAAISGICGGICMRAVIKGRSNLFAFFAAVFIIALFVTIGVLTLVYGQ